MGACASTGRARRKAGAHEEVLTKLEAGPGFRLGVSFIEPSLRCPPTLHAIKSESPLRGGPPPFGWNITKQ